MKKFWLTLGTVLAGMYALTTAYQHAFGQVATAQAGPAAAPPPEPAPALPLTQPRAEGGATYIYGPPSVYGGRGPYAVDSDLMAQSEEMQALMRKDIELEGQVQQTVTAYSDPNTDERKREDLRTGLTDLLDQQFSVRQERREMEIKQIEERVKKLRDALDKRADAKDKIIERRLNDLLSDAEGLGWGEAGPTGFMFGGPSVGRSPYGPGGITGGRGPARTRGAYGREGGASVDETRESKRDEEASPPSPGR